MRLHNAARNFRILILCALLATAHGQGPVAPSHASEAEDSTTTDTSSPTPSLTPEQLALISRYLTNVRAQPVGKVGTRNALAGQSIAFETTQDATLANGTLLPRGTRLAGRVVRAQAWQQGGPAALLSIQMDHAVLKDGRSIPIRCVLRTLVTSVTPSSGLIDASQGVSRIRRGGSGPGLGPVGGSTPLGSPTPMGSGPTGTPGGDLSGDSPLGSGGANNPGTMTTRSPVSAGGVPAGDAGVGGSGARPQFPNTTAVPSSAQQEMPVALAGESIHDIPRRTGLPGVMLSGTSVAGASGTLSAIDHDIILDSSIQLDLGVITR